ncbi:Pterin-binding domain protein [Acididesulfobacillus acetoxydans]|uniref:Pterin-binding domain profile n=1 Tax=Acididesulfobacillus acetoxydans TaxID=1561005 RepID=A0A8S0XB93_9FIRM|nr:dihydropteroate synthase [Acididesulfobacillus acetoxydans]CAA7600936.1 Pterin-binding domain protein [Acididesulfobacillus acetoxydans]CEJ08907.1 Pterin-binding domain profile [Acididesulfobacillus acetoxydans]
MEGLRHGDQTYRCEPRGNYYKRTFLIGERINPTSKKKATAALANGDFEWARQEAREQVAAGADILDVNVGAGSVDEV